MSLLIVSRVMDMFFLEVSIILVGDPPSISWFKFLLICVVLILKYFRKFALIILNHILIYDLIKNILKNVQNPWYYQGDKSSTI